MITERLNAYIHLFHQNLNINEVAEQQKYQRGGRDRGSQHSAGLGAGPERADAQGDSRPDRAKGPGASEPRRAAADAVACAEPGGRPASGALPCIAAEGGRQPARWRAGRLAPGGRSAVDRWWRAAQRRVAFAARRLLLSCAAAVYLYWVGPLRLLTLPCVWLVGWDL
jgi:hypothetical protein